MRWNFKRHVYYVSVWCNVSCQSNSCHLSYRLFVSDHVGRYHLSSWCLASAHFDRRVISMWVAELWRHRTELNVSLTFEYTFIIVIRLYLLTLWTRYVNIKIKKILQISLIFSNYEIGTRCVSFTFFLFPISMLESRCHKIISFFFYITVLLRR